MRGMIKARPVPNKIKLSSKSNFPGKWRSLIFPVEPDGFWHYGIYISQFPF